MKLSIIVPVYNMASDGKLNYCLDSLAAQTISDYEVITVDDASTDESFSILLEYEKKYPGKFKAAFARFVFAPESFLQFTTRVSRFCPSMLSRKTARTPKPVLCIRKTTATHTSIARHAKLYGRRRSFNKSR